MAYRSRLLAHTNKDRRLWRLDIAVGIKLPLSMTTHTILCRNKGRMKWKKLAWLAA